VQDNVFSAADLGSPIERERLLMSLNPEYYALIWQGVKRHEFRRRYPAGRPITWYVYLTAPASKLAAVIDLDPAIVDTPRRIADIAEQTREGNGESVLDYLKDLAHGFAIPITRVREYPGLTVDELTGMLGTFHPPQGYTFIDRNPTLANVCDELTSTDIVRELIVQHPAPSASAIG
jgi:predicted transcriptional regulator